MLNPDQQPRGLTNSQMRVMLNASETPRCASALNDGTIGRTHHLVAELVEAGFLRACPTGLRTTYAITPAGREFADLLERLMNARERLEKARMKDGRK